MFSIFWLIIAWQRSDCYAVLLVTSNSYTRLLSVLLLHPEVSLGSLIDSLKSVFLPLSLRFVFRLTVVIFIVILPSLIVFCQSVSCLDKVHPHPHCEQSRNRQYGCSSFLLHLIYLASLLSFHSFITSQDHSFEQQKLNIILFAAIQQSQCPQFTPFTYCVGNPDSIIAEQRDNPNPVIGHCSPSLNK